jgi:hypothetical protein
MILDLNAIFSNAQAITASAVSTNVIDLGVPGKAAYGNVQLLRNYKGDSIPLLIQVVQNFATLTSLTFTVQGSVDEVFTAPVTLAVTPAIPMASLVAGFIYRPWVELPRNNIYRFIRINYTVGGSNATAGQVTAGIVAAVDAAYRG